MNNKISWVKVFAVIVLIIFVSTAFAQPAEAKSLRSRLKGAVKGIGNAVSKAVKAAVNVAVSTFNFAAGMAVKFTGMAIGSDRLQRLGNALIDDSRCRMQNITADNFQDMRGRCQTGPVGSSTGNTPGTPSNPNPEPGPNPGFDSNSGVGGSGNFGTPPGRIIEGQP